jgi:hypothetical protein
MAFDDIIAYRVATQLAAETAARAIVRYRLSTQQCFDRQHPKPFGERSFPLEGTLKSRGFLFCFRFTGVAEVTAPAIKRVSCAFGVVVGWLLLRETCQHVKIPAFSWLNVDFVASASAITVGRFHMVSTNF